MQYAMACVPKSQGTPNLKNGKQGYITDYVSNESPKLAHLIVLCINEVRSEPLNYYYIDKTDILPSILLTFQLHM